LVGAVLLIMSYNGTKMAYNRAIPLLLLLLGAQLAPGRELRRSGSQTDAFPNKQLERSRKAQASAGYGDLETFIKALQRGKLDIKDLDLSKLPSAQTPAADASQPATQPQQPQQPPQVPHVVAPAPAPAAPQPAPIVNQPRGSLACSHQYNYGAWDQLCPQPLDREGQWWP
jgi:hypothetical protein